MDKMHSKMGRKYDDVMAMDAEINRWHDKETGQFTGKWSKHRSNGGSKPMQIPQVIFKTVH